MGRKIVINDSITDTIENVAERLGMSFEEVVDLIIERGLEEYSN